MRWIVEILIATVVPGLIMSAKKAIVKAFKKTAFLIVEQMVMDFVYHRHPEKLEDIEGLFREIKLHLNIKF